jgi:hypothetical protein
MMDFHLTVARGRKFRQQVWLVQVGNRAFGHPEKIAAGCAQRQAWYLQKLEPV